MNKKKVFLVISGAFLFSLFLLWQVGPTVARPMVKDQNPTPTFPTLRIPDDQVPLDRVHTVGVEQVIQVTDSQPSSETTASSWPAHPLRVPDELASDDVKDIESVVLQGWTLRHEAGLEKNRGKEEAFKRDLQRYFSDLPKQSPENNPEAVDEMIMGEVQLPPEKTGQASASVRPSPLQQLDASASELERQRTYIDNGRYFEQTADFVVLDFKVDKVAFKRVRLEGDSAEVVVDIFFRSKYLHTNPDGTQIVSEPVGGEQHTFKLIHAADGWKVTDDSFIMIPGYEP